MELDAKTRLRRFCYIGSEEPVYVHLRSAVNVKDFWPKMTLICQALDDETFIIIIKDVLQQPNLVRRDEALFIYAVYLASELDVKWKTNVRIAFPACVRTDDDLFLFCKYAVAIQKEKEHKGFSKTMRKAITAWYEQHTPDEIHNMWMQHRGAYGFTHRALLKLCHVNDDTVGEVGVVSPFFKTCTELLKMSDGANAVTGENNTTSKSAAQTNVKNGQKPTAPDHPTTSSAAKSAQQTASSAAKLAQQTTSSAVKSAQQTPSKSTAKSGTDEKKPTTPLSTSVISMSRLRLTKNKVEALKIIQKYKLHYSQVPGHLLRYAPIMEALIPSMSYLQLFKCWRNMARYNHFENPKVLKLCQAMLDNKKMLRKNNVHPVVLLLQLDKLGIREDISKLAPKKVEAMRMNYLKEIYLQSFGYNQGTGLRMHITINLQTNYKKKLLNNTKKLSYIEAAVALAFGYYKKEGFVDVFHWEENKTKLLQVPWTKEMDLKAARECCNQIENSTNAQRLVVPIMNALTSKQVYDVFVAIVPSAGRGNPKQNSEFLCKFLDRYRESKNTKAKYVIVNLRKFKRSMAYSLERNENILEICGLDEHTPDLINNFALNRFG